MRAVERRRGMGAHEKEPFVIPYITDGLILYLDGIEQGDTANVWTDLINGLQYVKNSSTGITFNDNNVAFGSSNNQCLYNSRAEFVNASAGTIEACYRDVPTSGTKTLFYSVGIGSSGYGGQGISFQFVGGNRVAFSAGNAVTRPKNGAWTAGATGTYSISAARIYQNGVSKSFTTSTDYPSRINAVSVIGGNGSYQQTLGGKIHCIRIYNRQLTEEEVLFNQRIDNMRFNLGLTIPT